MPTEPLPKYGHYYELRWSMPGEPPAGMALVQASGFALSSSHEDIPQHIRARQTELGLGSGWMLNWWAVNPPAQRHTDERRAAQRQRNLTRRVEKSIGPLFSAQVIAEEQSKRPEYFSGQREPAHAARIAELDALDAQRWEAYVQWWTAYHQERRAA